MQNFGTVQQPLLGELAMSRREEEKFIVATYVSACSQGQRMHSARTKIGADLFKETYIVLVLLNSPSLVFQRLYIIFTKQFNLRFSRLKFGKVFITLTRVLVAI